MNPNILYNAVTAFGLLPMLATEGIKSVCGAFGMILKGKKALLTFVLVWGVALYPWLPAAPNTDPNTGNSVYYIIHFLLNFLAAIGVYNFVRRFINAIEGKKIPDPTK